MYETLQMMKQIRNPDLLERSYDELVIMYQEAPTDAVLAECFIKLYNLICQIKQKYKTLKEEEFASLFLEFTYHALRTYDVNLKKAKFATYAATCINYAFLRECKAQQTQSRKIQFYISDKAMESKGNERSIADIDDYIEDVNAINAFEDVEFELVYKHLQLTPSEKFFVDSIMKGMTTKEIAEAWGVTTSRIHIVRRALQRKLGKPIEDWQLVPA